ncbi:MAG: hypothetical protein RJA70_4169 [Pseudomonadota bacterium]|jgi:hypothetical protein
MLTKALVWIALLLFLGKVFFRKQLRGLGKRLDRLVNYTIAAFLISYAISALLRL